MRNVLLCHIQTPSSEKKKKDRRRRSTLTNVGQKPRVQWQTTPPSQQNLTKPNLPRRLYILSSKPLLSYASHQREVHKLSHPVHLPRGAQRAVKFNRQAALTELKNDPDAKEVSERCGKEERFQPPRSFTRTEKGSQQAV